MYPPSYWLTGGKQSKNQGQSRRGLRRLMDKDKERQWQQFLGVCILENVDGLIVMQWKDEAYSGKDLIRPRHRVICGLVDLWGPSKTGAYIKMSARQVSQISANRKQG